MFTTRRDFDCGWAMNAWSIFVVNPNGSHIGELQFSMDEEKKAEAACAAMNKACGFTK